MKYQIHNKFGEDFVGLPVKKQGNSLIFKTKNGTLVKSSNFKKLSDARISKKIQ